MTDVFAHTDWALLAQQKLTLLALEAEEAVRLERGQSQKPLAAEHLSGVIAWLDGLQDSAAAQGYPVVFLTDGTEKPMEIKIVEIDVLEVRASQLGRTFSTRIGAVRYAKRHGFTTVARVTGVNGVFYAPLATVPVVDEEAAICGNS